jgi:PAS domain S-box-containing protein
MFKSILDNIQDAYIRADIDGNIVLVSPSASRMYRFDSPQEMTGLSALSLYKYVKDRNSLIEKLNEDGKAEDFESTALRKDGTTFLVSLNSQYYYNDKGQIQGTEAFVRDITERKNLEFENELSKGFLELVNESNNVSELIHSALNFFRQKSGCEAVGIRLKKGEDYPYYETQGFPEYFIKLENNLCSYNECGNPEVDSEGYPIMECMCGNVICDRFDPSQPFFTINGSFWTNNTTKLLATSSEDDRQARTRNRCNGEGYESVALIPLISGVKKLGLLQLNDTRKNLFSQELITVWERLTGYLSIALEKFLADEHKQQLLGKETELIAELKVTNEELHESEERLRLAQTRGNVGVWDWNTITDELHFTPELEQLYGLTPGTIKTYQDWRQLTHPDDIGKIEVERDDKIAENEPFDLEFRIFHNSGEIHWLSSKGGAIYDNQGDVLRVLGVNTDITDRKNAELLTQKLLESEQQLTEELKVSNEELQSTTQELQISNEELRHQGHNLLQINKALEESEERFHDLADNIPNLAWMADATGWIFWYNTQWFDYTGTTLEEMKGWGWQKVHHPDYVESITEEWEFNIKAGKPYDNIFPLKGKDGKYRWFLTRVTPIRDEQGKLLRWFGTNTDITELKQSEEELKRSNIELERFAYVSSHDLQEPLRMVTLYSQLLERRYKDNLDNDANDFIEYIVEGANRMRQLIDDLLEYSRVTSQAKEFEKVDLEKVLDVVLHNLAIPIQENNVTISHDSLPTVFVDKNQMVQVFQNLINNAIKFHGQNTPNIYISAQKDDQKWKFAVKDNGIGIEPKHQKQIFKVFKRLHTREEYPGTGIGLSITQKIIIHHGGQIWVESELGKGTTFFFTIPTT